MRTVCAGQVYRHFKGNLYRVLALATHSETGETLVVYQKLYGEQDVWARPLGMFLSPVDREKYPDVPEEYRFTLYSGPVREENRVYIPGERGETLAEVTFPPVEPGVVNIDHTFVDASLRGQGVAGKLLAKTAAALRETGHKAMLTCGYAVGWFEKHPEQADLLK